MKTPSDSTAIAAGMATGRVGAAAWVTVVMAVQSVGILD
jgi:hypothetical protein